MRRQLDRTGMKEPLTPEHFRFMSKWMLVLLHIDAAFRALRDPE